jgi:hypothetical protein
MWHVWRRGEMHTGLWWRSLTKRVHLENQGIGRRIILKHIFKKKGV